MTRLSKAAAVACLLATAGPSVHEAQAQAWRPIYLQYDGYVANQDGTYILAFGYYNTNEVDVPIEVGPANHFTGDPADRGQPGVFMAGRHRFACTMVVGPDWDGRLQWVIQFAGTESATTLKSKDPLYQLEAGSQEQATAGLDLKGAARGVCLNRPPSVRLDGGGGRGGRGGAGARPVLMAAAGHDLQLTALVEDDGLPRGAAVELSWAAVSGPGPVVFAEPASASTAARFASPGDYVVALTASDGEGSNRVEVAVKVE